MPPFGVRRTLPRATSKKKHVAARWPDPKSTPAQAAARVEYIGSAQHKSHPTPLDPTGRLRSTAEKCPPVYQTAADLPRLTQALRDAVKAGRVSTAFDAPGLPRYVWPVLDGQLYECRRLSHPSNGYYGYPIVDPSQEPHDPAGKLKP